MCCTKTARRENEILEEVWWTKDAFAKRCHYDLACMMKELQRIEQDPENPLVHAKKKPTGKVKRTRFPPRGRRRARYSTTRRSRRLKAAAERLKTAISEIQMRVYTYSEARQKLAEVFEHAESTGEVLIRRKDGRTFTLVPEPAPSSPLDVPSLRTDISTEEIVATVRQGREKQRYR